VRGLSKPAAKPPVIAAAPDNACLRDNMAMQPPSVCDNAALPIDDADRNISEGVLAFQIRATKTSS
jgi:hypothetical protein